jgi:hypothetical protein
MGEEYAAQERCEYCDGGSVDGDPIPTPDGPYYPTLTCTACNGDGWVVVEYEPITEDELYALDVDLEDMIYAHAQESAL